MLTDDHVHRLKAKGICAAQYRARVMRVGNAVEHQNHVVGAGSHDLGDPFQTLGRNDWRKGLDDQISGPLELRRARNVDQVWVVRSHLLGGLFGVDDDADDQGPALIGLPRDEEWIAGRRNDLQKRQIVGLVGPIDGGFHFVASVRHHPQ